jgi:hypothetical protein
METNPPPGLPAETAQHSAPVDPLTQTVLEIADRLTALEQHTATRLELVRDAFGDLRSELRKGLECQGKAHSIITDDPRRRLAGFLGYEPSTQQQVELFTAYAAWHATNPKLVENRSAEYTTKKGQLVSYGYADLAGVIATAQTAAPFGLSAFTRQEFDDNGHPIVTGYLVHSSGGATSSGPVPLFTADSDRPGQAHASGLTTCRRLALQMAMGLAAERDDDFNSSNETSAATRGATRPAAPARSGNERPMANPPRRYADPERDQRNATATTRPAPAGRQGPPPGWLSKEERDALEQELMDPAITPQRFAEIDEKLLAAKQSVSTSGGAGQ